MRVHDNYGENTMKQRLVAAVAASAAVLLTYAGSAAAVTTELKPAEIERGADIAIPHVEGKTLVDGDIRIGFADRPSLLGVAGDAYIVALAAPDRVLRVNANGTRKELFRGAGVWESRLSANGGRLARMIADQDRSLLQVIDTATGARVLSKRFALPLVSVLDYRGHRLVLSTFTSAAERTWIWSTKDGFVRVVAQRAGYLADLANDRVAIYTKDPYQGGCSKLITISRPTQLVWSSCTERIAALSPSATRMATIHILSDGLGPNKVTLRGGHGRALASYTAKWFGGIQFESDQAVLLETNGAKYAAIVRCTPTDCERATDLSPTPEY